MDACLPMPGEVQQSCLEMLQSQREVEQRKKRREQTPPAVDEGHSETPQNHQNLDQRVNTMYTSLELQ